LAPTQRSENAPPSRSEIPSIPRSSLYIEGPQLSAQSPNILAAFNKAGSRIGIVTLGFCNAIVVRPSRRNCRVPEKQVCILIRGKVVSEHCRETLSRLQLRGILVHPLRTCTTRSRRRLWLRTISQLFPISQGPQLVHDGPQSFSPSLPVGFLCVRIFSFQAREIGVVDGVDFSPQFLDAV
jgi:hypothetical protein